MENVPMKGGPTPAGRGDGDVRVGFPPELACARPLPRGLARLAVPLAGIFACLGAALLSPAELVGDQALPGQQAVDRSPVDLVLTADEQWLVTANETSNSASLVRVATGDVVDEVPCGERPAAVALAPDGRVLVTSAYSGELSVFEIAGERLLPGGKLHLGFEPRGIAVSRDSKLAYVALAADGAVAVVDLDRLEAVARIAVGPWPRHLALSPDGSRLAVGCAGNRSVAVVDTAERRMLFQESFGGINPGQMQVSADGKQVYFPWMIYRNFQITEENIRRGWVLGSRIARVRLDGPARREAITLDPRGMAVSDPYGLGLTSDESWLVASASGTHELLVYRMAALRFQSIGGPGDHIEPDLLGRPERFDRIPLGGRPMTLRIAADNRRVFVANYLANAVQEVDLEQRTVTRTISLGAPAAASVVRQGAEIFYDGRRSLDQWYSCHTCHYEGGTNAVAMDTMNDGTVRTNKTVLSLYDVARTGPWTWHGWQQDLQASLHKSLTETMLGPTPTEGDRQALLAFLDTIERPANPHRGPSGELSPAAERGKAIFAGDKAGCASCHRGEFFTDGEVHDVGLGSPNDAYEGFNTPSLRGVFNRVLFLHDGRAKSLEQLLTGPHNPGKVTGNGELTAEERADLIEYLKSL